MTKFKSRDVGVACMLNTEVGAVLAVLRGNTDHLSAPDDHFGYDVSIQQSLKSLRSLIFNPQQEWRNVDPSIYISPFLDVIQSDEVPAAATGVALSAILKFLRLEIFDEKTPGAKEAMLAIVTATTTCRLEKTDSGFEDAILMKILQVLSGIMNNPASALISDEAVCTIVNTCFQVVKRSAHKGDLLQRNAKCALHEIVQIVYSRLHEVEVKDGRYHGLGDESDGDEGFDADNPGYGIRCTADIFHFLCSLLNVVDSVETEGLIIQKIDEDVQIFALVLINTALELSGHAIGKHPKLLRIVQDDLFHHLVHYGSRSTPLILSMICSTVLNIYHFLRSSIRLQLEAFFTFVLFRIASIGNLTHLQEVALEGVINFCRQPTFLFEMYVNYDCAFRCYNVFEEMGKLLCKQAFPISSPLTSLQLQAFEGLVIIIHVIADHVDKDGVSTTFDPYPIELTEYDPFWEESVRDENDVDSWVRSLRQKKVQKRKIMIAGNHYNQDDKKGLDFLRLCHLVPTDPPDAKALACFFRFTPKLDKTMIGDYLGDPDEFHIQVLKEFANTFDFTGMVLDSALRTYLESFRLPGESQKIQRILEAFSERFYDLQSSSLFESKDAVCIFCYSLIMLNTDQHNPQVKKKMTEEEFIRNNRAINEGKDLPREYLSELFQSIAKNAIALDQTGLPPEMNPSRWIEMMNQSKVIKPFISCDFNHGLGRDMFATIAGPTVAALSATFEHADDDEVMNECVEGLISVARIARYGLEDILDELVASFCKFTTLLNPYASTEETLYIFANDLKPRMATLAVFTIANKFGESIRGAWRNIVECLLKLRRLKLLPPSIVELDNEQADDDPSHPGSESGDIISGNDSTGLNGRHKGSGMIGRFSHFLTMEGNEDSLVLGGSEFEQNLKVIQQCQIGNIFYNSSNLAEDSLLSLGRSLIFAAAGKGQKFSTAVEEEETVAFCWDLVIAIAFANINRFTTFWPQYHEYMLSVAQFPLFSPVPFAEKAILVQFKLCLKILSTYQSDRYLEELIFRSINLMWKFDKEILDTCCDLIMQTVSKIISEYPGNIQTQLGWKSLLHLLSVTGRHPEAYDQGVEALISLMSEGTYVSRTNYVYVIDCAFGFVALKNSPLEKNMHILDLMANSVSLLIQWYKNYSDPGSSASFASNSSTEDNLKFGNFTMNLFVKLGEALKKTSLARREEVRNQAVTSLNKSFMLAEELDLTSTNIINSISHVIFAMIDDLHEKMLEYSRRGNAEREMRSMEGTLKIAMELGTDVFLHYLKPISENTLFRSFWLGLLRRMDTCMKADLGEYGASRMQEVVPELLKKIIAALKETAILVPRDDDDLWEITYIQIQWIAPNLKGELFPDVDA